MKHQANLASHWLTISDFRHSRGAGWFLSAWPFAKGCKRTGERALNVVRLPTERSVEDESPPPKSGVVKDLAEVENQSFDFD